MQIDGNAMSRMLFKVWATRLTVILSAVFLSDKSRAEWLIPRDDPQQVAAQDLQVQDSLDSHEDSEAQRDRRVAQLIEMLGHENFRVRTNAQLALEKIGLPAYEQLRRALEHPNVQIARSVDYLLKSQNVTWWLESDSIEVRTRLQDYSSLDTSHRLTRLLELANLGTDDALLALCRIAKFENSETCSRAAAINFLNKAYKIDEVRRKQLAESALLTIKGLARTSNQWLKTYCLQTTGQQPFDLEVWKGYASQLNETNKLPGAVGLGFSNPGAPLREEQKLQVIKFYEWLTTWIGSEQDRSVVLEVARPSMKLVSANQYAVREYITWALEAKMPELVVELSQSQECGPLFEKDFNDVVYLLAEAYRKLQNETKANEIAERARKIPVSRMAGLGQLVRGNNKEYEASQRSLQSRYLADRGQFDWAEAELKEAVALNSRMDWSLRYELAEFYREAHEYGKAVETIEPIALSDPPDKSLPMAEFNHPMMLAHYHWYKALQLIADGKQDWANIQLRQACASNQESSTTNPDILICYYRNMTDAEDKAYFRTYFRQMVENFRSDVAEQESFLARDATRRNPHRLAECCNQLAWLLSNCQSNVDEALYLSQRSLDLQPDVSTYLDTYARCCFAAGKLEDAVMHQTKALASSPHSRSMKDQLDEFKKALDKQSGK